MRVLFAGSPAVAVPTLEALQEDGHHIVGVLSQPPRPVGRKRVLTPTAVAARAQELGLDVFTPTDSAGVLEMVRQLKPDIAIVVAYGRILKKPELDAVPGGWWNVHFSLLPRWRGAAPVQHALLAGDDVTGITVFQIHEQLDTGPIALQETVTIAAHDTAHTLLRSLGERAPHLIVRLLRDVSSGSLVTRAQEGDVSYAPKLTAHESAIDLHQPALLVYRIFQAITPEPGGTLVRSDTGTPLKLKEIWPEPHVRGLKPGELKIVDKELLVGTGDIALVLKTVQPAGKREMTGLEWFRGLPAGVMLSGS